MNWPWTSKCRVTEAETQRDYWQILFDEERKRADRLMDRILEIHGQYPVSEETATRREDIKTKAAQLMQETEELFMTETPEPKFEEERAENE